MSELDHDLPGSAASEPVTLPAHAAARHAWIGLAQPLTRASGWLALAPVLVLAAFLNFYQLSREGYANTYYAAAVKSMMHSWHNFFFVSFDPGGFVTVDKPPLGFWIQTLSVRIFGFHGWSLILPEALAGVASVALVFQLVRPRFGETAGLIAALVMAVSPVAISTNRSNIVDTLLVFTLLLGAWAVLRAAERGQLRWFLLAMLFVGLGFNIKMLQAYLVVPAFFALYFLGARLRWRTKIWQLALAGVVLLVVSFAWAVTVDAIPADQRPYVGSSQDNSELNLILGYNGIQRLIPRGWSIFGLHVPGFGRSNGNTRTAQRAPAGGFGPGGSGENGAAGVLRLVNTQLGGEAGWLLPLALLGLVVAAWQIRPRFPLGRQHQSLLLWGGWLLTAAIFFSVAGFFHAYYLIMLAPPIAALCGAGFVALWRDYRRRRWLGWLLPLALVAAGASQIRLLRPYPDFSRWLSPMIAILCGAAALGLIVVRLMPRLRWPALSVALASAGLLGLLLAPTVWAAETTLHDTGGLTPSAGPRARGGQFAVAPNVRLESFDTAERRFTAAPPAGFAQFGAPGDGSVDSAMLNYLLAQQGKTKFLVATTSSNTASPFILATGKPVMALGGFSGGDQILTTDELARFVANGTVRFFLLDGAGGAFRAFTPTEREGFGASGDQPKFGTPRARPGEAPRALPDGTPNAGPFGQSTGLTGWVVSNCTAVPSSTWDTGSTSEGSFQRGGQLYDCANVKSGA
jgi:4-amino-4-deoxy-L-arabinose transferase-like glycosyltransferase